MLRTAPGFVKATRGKGKRVVHPKEGRCAAAPPRLARHVSIDFSGIFIYVVSHEGSLDPKEQESSPPDLL